MIGYVDSDGVKLAVDVIGEGDPVTVIAHGLTGTRRQLGLIAPIIPGTKVLCAVRGHGDRDFRSPTRSIAESLNLPQAPNE